MGAGELKFKNQVLLDIVRVSNLLTKTGDQFFKPYGVTSVQYNVLVVLRNSDSGLGQHELSSRLVVSGSDITGIIDRLEKRGLVKRLAHKTDRRVKVIEVTEDGLDLIVRVEQKYFENVERFAKKIRVKELEILKRVILKLENNIGGNND